MRTNEATMETVTVFTNLTCNQRCGFCTFRRPSDAPGFADGARIRAEIRAAAERRAKTLVLSGGEPTLSPALAEHVRFAREAGIERVVLETNAMVLAYRGRAEALAAAGLTGVRVAMHAAEPASSDAVSGVEGGFAITLRGMESARAAGLAVEVSLAVTRPALAELARVPALLAARGVRDLLLRVVTDAEERWVPRYDEAARAVVEVADQAREHGVAARLDGRHGVPLCFFPERRRYPELFAFGASRGAHGITRIAACEGCAARERCPGLPTSYLAVHGELGASPVPERQARFVAGLGRDRARAVEAELINDAFMGQAGGGLERVLRVDFHCNQACSFCFVDRTLPAVPYERLEHEIRRAAQDGVALLSLSGGEPTLHPRLVDLVGLARGEGLRAQLQTNAVRCSEEGYARALAAAGLERAFVSLHAASAETSDAITAAPGTFARTLVGIDNLLAAGVAVTTNFVITSDGFPELPAYARLVAERWGGSALSVNLSFVHASTDLVPRDVAVIPRMSEVRRYVGEALSILRAAGVPWQGFDGQCGMPLCLLEEGWYDVEALEPLPSPEPPRGFVKVEGCRDCALTDRCVGLRETYAGLYGTAEIGGREVEAPPRRAGKPRLPVV